MDLALAGLRNLRGSDRVQDLRKAGGLVLDASSSHTNATNWQKQQGREGVAREEARRSIATCWSGLRSHQRTGRTPERPGWVFRPGWDSPVDRSPIKVSRQPPLALTGLHWAVLVGLDGVWTGSGWACLCVLLVVQREAARSQRSGARSPGPGGGPAAEPAPVLVLSG